MKFLNKKGTVLLFAVVAMTVISVLGTGIYFMTTTATFSGLDANDQNRAYQLAVAGRDYALVKNLTATAGRDFTLTNNGGKFRLAISGDSITSTGIVREGTPYEAKRTIKVIKTGFGSQADVSFTKDIADFSKTIGPTLQTQSGLVIVNPLGQVEMGQEKTYSFGGISYGGSAVQGNCNNGICDFNGGFRAYFKFKLVKAPSATGDPHGFVFTFFHGYNPSTGIGNLSTAIGGDLGWGADPTAIPPILPSGDMPELLGYAGDSCTARPDLGARCSSFLDGTGQGIQPPKVGIEFDSRQQTYNTGSCSLEQGCFANSRCDGTRDHMAYVFWGDYNTTKCKYEFSPTYDDNKHGAGTAESNYQPINSIEPPAYNDYFISSWPSTHWLYSDGATYAVRVEVLRGSTKNANNNYSYRIRTWVKKCPYDISVSTCCSKSPDFDDFDNVKVAFNDLHSADLPNLDRTIELNQDNHVLFNKLAWGWRFASGGSSPENVTIANFNMYFIK